MSAIIRHVTVASPASPISRGVIIIGPLLLGETASTAYRGDRGKTAYDHSQSAHLALGETDSTAYRGDRGKTAYDHSQSAHLALGETAGTAYPGDKGATAYAAAGAAVSAITEHEGTTSIHMPAGGTTGQVLLKNSNNAYDCGWGAAAAVLATPNTTVLRDGNGSTQSLVSYCAQQIEVGSNSAQSSPYTGVVLFRDASTNFYMELLPVPLSVNREIYLPNDDGTIALRKTTLAGYGITDAATPQNISDAFNAAVPKSVITAGNQLIGGNASETVYSVPIGANQILAKVGIAPMEAFTVGANASANGFNAFEFISRTTEALARADLGLGNSATCDVGNNAQAVASGADARLGVLATWVITGANNNGTITWPAGASHFSAIIIGAGGGGGSGGHTDAAATRTGGQGGAPGGLVQLRVRPITALTSNTYSVGCRGTGAANNGLLNNGLPGTAGNNSTFGQFIALGGAGGLAGNNTGSAPATTGTNGAGIYHDEWVIGAKLGTTISSVTAIPSSPGNNASYVPGAGGAGAGMTAANAGFAGGNAAGCGILGGEVLYGAGGFVRGGNGGPTSGATQAAKSGNAGTQSILRWCGSGGGGGASGNTTVNGGNGGPGAEGGGGGGGGGCSNNTTYPGTGANGGNGYISITAYGSNAGLGIP